MKLFLTLPVNQTQKKLYQDINDTSLGSESHFHPRAYASRSSDAVHDAIDRKHPTRHFPKMTIFGSMLCWKILSVLLEFFFHSSSTGKFFEK